MCLIYFLYSLLSFLLVSKFASYLLDWYWLPRTRQATMSLTQLRGHGKLMAVREVGSDGCEVGSNLDYITKWFQRCLMDLIVFGYFHLLPILSPIISIWWSPTPSCPGDRGHGGVIPKCHELSDWGRHLLRWFLLFGFTKSMEQLCCWWDWASGIGNHNITLGFPIVPPSTVPTVQHTCSISKSLQPQQNLSNHALCPTGPEIILWPSCHGSELL